MTTDADNAAIAALTQKVVASWAHGDADGFASVFTDEGTMILPGVFCKDPDEVRSYMADAFQGRYKGTQVTGKPIGIRSITADVAILLSYGGVLERGETEPSETGAIVATWLAVRKDGQWKLAAYQNSPRYDSAAAGSDRAA